MEERKYFYVKGVPNHVDLKDLFNGEYISDRQEWRFDKKLEKDVLDFLYCSSCDEDDVVEMNCRKSRLHRAKSFNASDTSDEEHDSMDGEYRRHRRSQERISEDNKEIQEFLNSDGSDDEKSNIPISKEAFELLQIKKNYSVSDSSDEEHYSNNEKTRRHRAPKSKITK